MNDARSKRSGRGDVKGREQALQIAYASTLLVLGTIFFYVLVLGLFPIGK